MTNSLEVYGSVYDYPGKGHDRLFLDNASQFFGVLDGAGGDELSESAIRALPGAIKRASYLRGLGQSLFMANVIAEIDGLPEGSQRRSTAALACVALRQEDAEVTYANAGDSSVYFYNKTKGRFGRVAHTPTSYVQVNGRTYIDTEEFLGSRRTPLEISSLIGRLILPVSDEWSLIGITDGVQDDDGQGLNETDLEEIVRYTDSKYVSAMVLDSINKYDDASVFIVAHQTSLEENHPTIV